MVLNLDREQTCGKLERRSWASARMAGLPTDGGLFQVIRVHGDALTDGHFHGHVDKLGLCELGVEDAQAEPVCQGGLVLDGLAGVDFVAVPVG